MIYFPEEDSFLLEKYVRAFLRKSLWEKKFDIGTRKVLDMGTGSGILAKTALENTEDVLAVDIDEDAVRYATRQGINARKSDLFSNVNGKFDVIIFNPPYLPSSKYKDIALDGGKRGYEVIERFLKDAGKYLNKNGIILLLYSSLSKPRRIKDIIKENGLIEEILEDKKVAFEKLYVVKLKKKDF